MLAILGVGSMGEALLRGLLGAGVYAPGEVAIYSRTASKVQALAEQTGVQAASSALEAVQDAEVILIAVKPQMIEAALAPLRDVITADQTVISVAAGVSTTRIEACFTGTIPVVRVMPNTPSLVGEGAAAICGGAHAEAVNIDAAKRIFEAVGTAVEVAEKAIDAVTGLSGSGPAYVFAFIEALADGGVRQGLPRDVALKLAAQTVLGAGKMVLETGDHPGVLKDRVASPGGTTIAGLHALEQGAFRGVVMNAVSASAERSRELG